MSSFKGQGDLVREGQDGTERHSYGELSFSEGVGPSVKVEGNETKDEGIPVLTIGGTTLHMEKGTDAEVFLIGNGDDTNGKFAIVTGPRDKVYKSKPGQAWTQDPTDPAERVGFTKKGLRLASAKSIATWDGAFEVKGGKIYFRVPVISAQPIVIGAPPTFEQE